jgi:2-C-methyl-D-erythritol 4-phosphate cytidylyltransferase
MTPGERFGEPGGKQLVRVGGIPMVARTVLAFDEATRVGEIVLVCDPDRLEEYERTVRDAVHPNKPLLAAPGGVSRQHSVERGLERVSSDASVIVIHDGARPLVTPQLIDSMVDELLASDADGLVAGHPSYDTLKMVEDRTVRSTPDRSRFWTAQTPQVFRAAVLRQAYARAFRSGLTGTDDSSLVEAAGGTVRMFAGPRENIKVTVPEDVAFVDAVLSGRGDVR